MPRFALVLLVIAAVALAGCNKPGDAPVDTPTPTPTGPPPPPPPPTAGSIRVAPNDTWSYRGGTEAEPEEVLVRVIAVNDTTVRLRSTTTALNNDTTTSTVTTVDKSTFAIMVLEDGRIGATLRFDPPLPLLVPAEDHTYQGSVSVATPLGPIQQPASGNVTFLGLENITVPAGTFETYHYRAVFATTGFFTFEQHIEAWFAPKVDQPAKTITDGRVQELVEYSRAT